MRRDTRVTGLPSTRYLFASSRDLRLAAAAGTRSVLPAHVRGHLISAAPSAGAAPSPNPTHSSGCGTRRGDRHPGVRHAARSGPHAALGRGLRVEDTPGTRPAGRLRYVLAFTYLLPAEGVFWRK
jgi:hypothetical protein